MERNNIIDSETIQKAANGDSAAFDTIYREYRDKIYYYIIKLGAKPQDADDIVSETFLEAMKHIGDLKNESGLSSWLHTIAKNKYFALNRKENRHQRVELLAGDDDEDNVNEGLELAMQHSSDMEDDMMMLPEDYAESEETKDILADMVNSLNDNQREAIYLFYHRDKSLDEIATMTGVSVNTVKSRIHQAKNHLRKKIDELQSKGVVLSAAPVSALFKSVDVKVKVRPGIVAAKAFGGLSSKIAAIACAAVIGGTGIALANGLKNKGPKTDQNTMWVRTESSHTLNSKKKTDSTAPADSNAVLSAVESLMESNADVGAGAALISSENSESNDSKTSKTSKAESFGENQHTKADSKLDNSKSDDSHEAANETKRDSSSSSSPDKKSSSRSSLKDGGSGNDVKYGNSSRRSGSENDVLSDNSSRKSSSRGDSSRDTSSSRTSSKADTSRDTTSSKTSSKTDTSRDTTSSKTSSKTDVSRDTTSSKTSSKTDTSRDTTSSKPSSKTDVSRDTTSSQPSSKNDTTPETPSGTSSSENEHQDIPESTAETPETNKLILGTGGNTFEAEPGDIVRYDVSFMDDHELSAFQIDFDLPEGLEYVGYIKDDYNVNNVLGFDYYTIGYFDEENKTSPDFPDMRIVAMRKNFDSNNIPATNERLKVGTYLFRLKDNAAADNVSLIYVTSKGSFLVEGGVDSVELDIIYDPVGLADQSDLDKAET